jgi:hypothetical protein
LHIYKYLPCICIISDCSDLLELSCDLSYLPHSHPRSNHDRAARLSHSGKRDASRLTSNRGLNCRCALPSGENDIRNDDRRPRTPRVDSPIRNRWVFFFPILHNHSDDPVFLIVALRLPSRCHSLVSSSITHIFVRHSFFRSSLR